MLVLCLSSLFSFPPFSRIHPPLFPSTHSGVFHMLYLKFPWSRVIPPSQRICFLFPPLGPKKGETTFFFFFVYLSIDHEQPQHNLSVSFLSPQGSLSSPLALLRVPKLFFIDVVAVGLVFLALFSFNSFQVLSEEEAQPLPPMDLSTLKYLLFFIRRSECPMPLCGFLLPPSHGRTFLWDFTIRSRVLFFVPELSPFL